MTDLTSMTIAEAKAGLANKSFTSLELTDAHLAAIEGARSLNAFILETPDQARAMARAIDARIATGGSIRQPAAFTATVGVKPTYGRCSRWGIVAFASSLDQAGPIARTVRDSAILMRSMAGHDPKDTTSVNVDVPDYEAAIGKSVKGMKIGIPKEYRLDGMPAEIEKLWTEGAAWLKSAGAELIDVSLPHTKYALPAYYIVAPAEASSNLARYDGVDRK